MTISRDGMDFYAQVTGQPRVRRSFPNPKAISSSRLSTPSLPSRSMLKAAPPRLCCTNSDATSVCHVLKASRSSCGSDTNRTQSIRKSSMPMSGKYHQLNPDSIITVTNENGHLFMEVAPAPKIEVFPETPRDFFLRLPMPSPLSRSMLRAGRQPSCCIRTEKISGRRESSNSSVRG
jgi:hypothetical protein